jgi:dihydroorotate dehydrogenase (fumarate)/dihydroorotate dehydrogenase
MDPERVHNLALRGSALAGRLPLCRRLLRSGLDVPDPLLRRTIAGIDFENPIGLAAGFDKNGSAVNLLGSLGFGHVEIGSISAHPSVGNPRPRLFRIPEDRGIVVYYGVPNDGAKAVAARLRHVRCAVPLGINLVKTNDPQRPPTDEEVLSDYTTAFSELQPHAAYINLNLSCPNCANDRNYFDDVDKIDELLRLLARQGPVVPVFLKIKPTTDRAWIRDLIGVSDAYPFVAGFGINLPAGKPSELTLRTSRDIVSKLPGAVSGPPVTNLINANLKLLFEAIGPQSRYRLMAAGGVTSGDDAYLKIRLGASLVQFYTALVYEGPGITKKIVQRLQFLLHRDGFKNVGEAVGSELTVP